ncbi:hypothetical protein C8J57DRAFT_1524377 [Mycena rebaudengoi]|nr:hypothetical protein C8J57DRAFT_1524377 [Mycena rebaudengoi]
MARQEVIQQTPCTATWYNMMSDLVGDPRDLVRARRTTSRKSFAPLIDAPTHHRTPAGISSPASTYLPATASESSPAQHNVSPHLPATSDGSQLPSVQTPTTVTNSPLETNDTPPTYPPGPLISSAREEENSPLLADDSNTSFPADGRFEVDRDADTIPSALDNPPVHIHLSDLIILGTILDMAIENYTLAKPTLNMAGQYCNITLQDQQGVGMTAWYSTKPNHVHKLQSCVLSEIRNLARTGQGYLKIGDYTAHTTDWGYNSVNAVFEAAKITVEGDDWQETKLPEGFYPQSDDDIQWGGCWCSPLSPHVGLLLASCGNPAVVNSFPHRLLAAWDPSDRGLACRNACQQVNDGVQFIQAPENICSALQANGVLLQNDYKMTNNNWGSEHGGMRGWCMSIGAEFVVKVAPVWPVEDQSE